MVWQGVGKGSRRGVQVVSDRFAPKFLTQFCARINKMENGNEEILPATREEVKRKVVDWLIPCRVMV